MTHTRHARWSWFVLVPALLAFTLLGAAPASGAEPPRTQAPSAYILVDAGSGAVLLAQGEHEPHFTASTIKVLTALVAVEHRSTAAGLTISRLTASQPASKIDMKEGSTWTVDQALHSLMIISANDAAYALAENVGGDLARFATLANSTARRLGMQNTDFHDPAGLDGAKGFEGGTKSSAYDLAIAARNALTVPAIADPAASVTYEFTDPTGAGRRLVNHNRGFLTSYPGAIGLKTGFTNQAGRTLITAARRDGRTLIAVVMGTWDDTGWAGYLLDQGFAGTAAGTAPNGAGVTLPPVRVAPLDARTGAFAQTPHIFGTTPAAEVLGATATRGTPDPPPTPPSSAALRASSKPAPARTGAAPATATRKAPSSNSDGGGTIASVVKTLAWIALVLLIVAVILRRRAVKRQRARRIEQLRAHREARRRGMIDIVDPDDAVTDVRLLPTRTAHHVASAGKRHPSDRRVVRPARPRSPSGAPRDRSS